MPGLWSYVEGGGAELVFFLNFVPCSVWPGNCSTWSQPGTGSHLFASFPQGRRCVYLEASRGQLWNPGEPQSPGLCLPSCIPTIQEGKVRLVPARCLHPKSGSPDCQKGGAATMAWEDFLGEEF